MIFYNTPDPAPNPRRVRLFATEKGIDLPMQDIAIMRGEHRQEPYLAVNPLGQTPSLQLDDGTVLTESVAICRYLEGVYPDRPLFGTTPLETATIEMWMRRAELRLMTQLGQYWVNNHPFTARLPIRKFPEFGEQSKERALTEMTHFDAALGDRTWLAGESFTMADIILLTTIDFGAFIGIAAPDELENLKAWHTRAAERCAANAG